MRQSSGSSLQDYKDLDRFFHIKETRTIFGTGGFDVGGRNGWIPGKVTLHLSMMNFHYIDENKIISSIVQFTAQERI